MFPVMNPWDFISSPKKSSPKEKGKMKERQSVLTWQWGQLLPPRRYVQDNLAISLRGSGACCSLEQRNQNQTHPAEECDLGEPFHILPECHPSESQRVGFFLSCQTGTVSLWKLISLQWNPAQPASIKLPWPWRNGLETWRSPPKWQHTVKNKNKRKVKGTGLAYHFVSWLPNNFKFTFDAFFSYWKKGLQGIP